jgi:hypothetical protein
MPSNAVIASAPVATPAAASSLRRLRSRLCSASSTVLFDPLASEPTVPHGRARILPRHDDSCPKTPPSHLRTEPGTARPRNGASPLRPSVCPSIRPDAQSALDNCTGARVTAAPRCAQKNQPLQACMANHPYPAGSRCRMQAIVSPGLWMTLWKSWWSVCRSAETSRAV